MTITLTAFEVALLMSALFLLLMAGPFYALHAQSKRPAITLQEVPPTSGHDTARAHLQAVVSAYDTGTKTELEDAVHHAAIYLKGGL